MAEASATIGSADASSSSPRNNGNENNNSSSNIEKDEEPTILKSRKPSDVALTQQRMKSWQPLLDPKWIIAAYLAIGIIFIPTGELVVHHERS